MNDSDVMVLSAADTELSLPPGYVEFTPEFAKLGLYGSALDQRAPPTNPAVSFKNAVIQRGPAEVMFTHDRSCNISCPSCRREVIMASRAEQARMDTMISAMKATLADSEVIIMSGAGDPLASRHFRRFLKEIRKEDFPQGSIHLMTNGMLLNPASWEEFQLEGKVGSIGLSMDSCVPETYEVIRRGSKWKTLLEHLPFYAELRQRNSIRELSTFFTTQRSNYAELPDFIRFARARGFDIVQLAMIRNMAYSESEFASHFIGSAFHPEYGKFLEILKDPTLDDPMVYHGEISPFIDEAYRDSSRALDLAKYFNAVWAPDVPRPKWQALDDLKTTDGFDIFRPAGVTEPCVVRNIAPTTRRGTPTLYYGRRELVLHPGPSGENAALVFALPPGFTNRVTVRTRKADGNGEGCAIKISQSGRVLASLRAGEQIEIEVKSNLETMIQVGLGPGKIFGYSSTGVDVFFHRPDKEL